MPELKNSIFTFFEDIESFMGRGLDEDSLIKSFEMFNLSDDCVIYSSIFVLASICLFIVCGLTNFYRIKHKEIIYVSMKSDTSNCQHEKND